MPRKRRWRRKAHSREIDFEYLNSNIILYRPEFALSLLDRVVLSVCRTSLLREGRHFIFILFHKNQIFYRTKITFGLLNSINVHFYLFSIHYHRATSYYQANEIVVGPTIRGDALYEEARYEGALLH